MTRTVVRNGVVFDGTGSPPRSADVTFEDGRVVDVGLGLDGDVEIDAAGMAVLPGLFDCHIHAVVSGSDTATMLARPFSYQFYEAARNLSATLDCGITTVRDAAGADLGIRQASIDGLIDGPRMHISISALSQTGGHYDGTMPSGICVTPVLPYPGRPCGIADGPDAVRREVREIIRSGADVIKICASGGVLSPRDKPQHAQFRDDEIAAIVAEANAVDLPVMAHAHATDGVKASVRAGIRSIEHGTFLDSEAIEMMVERGTWLVPTLSAPQAVVASALTGGRFPQSVVDKAKALIARHTESFELAVAAGVKIAMGTDSGVFPHGSNLKELALMAEAGLGAIGALVASTSSAARLMRLDNELGTLETGKRADIVLMAGDALDLHDMRSRIRVVVKDGVTVRRFGVT